MSLREDIAHDFANLFSDLKLTQPYGNDVRKMGRYYGVLFCYPRTIDGLVRVYSPNWILVEAQGPGVPGGRIKEKFETFADAESFIKDSFEGDR